MSDATIAVCVLAAGGSSRLGRPKQLEPIAGEPLIHRQTRIALESAVGPVGIVLGGSFDPCAAAIAHLPDATILRNDAWADGQSTSVRAAVAFARACDAAALLILLGDQYAVAAADLRHLAVRWRERGPTWTIATRHDADAGPPAIVPRATFAALEQLTGDIGARHVLATADPIERLTLAPARFDLDTEHDARRAR